MHLWTLREGTVAAFDEERQLVREVESRLPAGCHGLPAPAHDGARRPRDLPADALLRPRPRRTCTRAALRWSWGAMIGRQHDWGRAVDALPMPDKVRVLAVAGFSGIWIDRWGYTGKERPAYAEVEKELGAIVGEPFLVSTRRPLLVRQPRALSPAPGGAARAGAARPRSAASGSRTCRSWSGGKAAATRSGRRTAGGGRVDRSAACEIRNWRPGALQVTLSARLPGGRGRGRSP